jgi:hypothetical protein
VGYMPPTEKPRPERPGLPANLAEHILGGKPLKLPEVSITRFKPHLQLY